MRLIPLYNMSTQKGMPLSKDEVMSLLELVASNPVVCSKSTNAANNRLKEIAWIKIAEKFNSIIRSSPRKPEQLRLKWENLKKNARKRTHKIRMCNQQLAVGHPEYIPPDEVLDTVAGMLGEMYDDSNVTFGCDAVENEEEIKDEVVQGVSLVEVPVMQDTSDSSESQQQPNTSEQYILFNPKSKGKLNNQGLDNSLKKSVIRRNNAIAEYYESKKRNDEELFRLQKRKLELELLQKI